ncbi:MAG: FG-GAP repeat protein [Deltaproteobacteria bacterium ADurb.Bin207]|nr:MAG: FG-GAP repeat protein [Deltaproteobacteria bacterium ADurb.Bin207]
MLSTPRLTLPRRRHRSIARPIEPAMTFLPLPNRLAGGGGGGSDYPDRLAPNPSCTVEVSTLQELSNALENAVAGTIVYVRNEARIDLTGQSLCIPGGVWLASGRGESGSAGGMLYSTAMTNTAVLKVCGDDVRITGLRIVGPDPTTCPPQYPNQCEKTGPNCAYCTPPSLGIRNDKYVRCEIDNNELTAWSYAAINLGSGADHRVHHNDIHHTQRRGLGYGVVLNATAGDAVDVLVEWNRFDYNRHAIAGSGASGQDYTSRHNLVLPHSIGHVFDMHGENERVGNGDPGAGGKMLIHENIVLVADQYSLAVRGRPAQGAWFYENCLARATPGEAARQLYFFGNFHVDESPSGAAPNRYGQSASSCAHLRWCFAPGGSAPFAYLSRASDPMEELALGDFDGDGKTDVFRSKNGRWEWSRGGVELWATLATSTITLSSLRFGDFDGDGKTDVFHATGSEWHVSYGGSSAWQTLRTASESTSQLAFGDFDGDGKTDVFTASGGQWKVCFGGKGTWQSLASSGVALGSLGFGDFDGDGKTDVFHGDGSAWRVSWAGTSSWEKLTDSSYGIDSLLLADIDGDGITDILRSDGSTWWVSRSATQTWERLRISSLDVRKLRVGDFDGDGLPDVFQAQCL